MRHLSLSTVYILTTLLLSIVHSQNSYNSSLPISETNCTIYYLSQSQNTRISLHNCTSSSFVFYQWNSCYHSCCLTITSPTPTLSLSALRNCQVQSSTSSELKLSIWAIIVISIMGLIALVLILCCLKMFCCKKKKENKRTIKDPRVKTVEWEDQKEVNYNFRRKLKWSSNINSQRPLKRPQQPCVICLDQTTIAQLVCGHQFHPECIGGWLLKGKTCPCCRHENIRGIRIYCQDCRWNYYVCTRTMLAVHAKDMPKVCSTCAGISEEAVESHNQLRNSDKNVIS